MASSARASHDDQVGLDWTTSRAALSSRSPRWTTCRSSSSRVHSTKLISITISGRAQCTRDSTSGDPKRLPRVAAPRAASCRPQAAEGAAIPVQARRLTSRCRRALHRSAFRPACGSRGAKPRSGAGCPPGRQPTTTNSSRFGHFVFSHDRRSGSYRPLMRLETMPSSPRSQASRRRPGHGRSGDHLYC